LRKQSNGRFYYNCDGAGDHEGLGCKEHHRYSPHFVGPDQVPQYTAIGPETRNDTESAAPAVEPEPVTTIPDDKPVKVTEKGGSFGEYFGWN
jgi:hypothetical protein